MGLFSKPDPVQQHARQFAKLLVGCRRKHPDRPLREAIRPVAPALHALFKAGSSQSQLLDLIMSDTYEVNSVQDVCCALVAMACDIPADASERYQHVVIAVKAELQALGFVESA